MADPAIDFRFSTNADWTTGFALMRREARPVPWLGTPAWTAGATFGLGSAVVQGGDLYVTDPAVVSGSFTAAATFDADLSVDGRARWLRVGFAAAFASAPYDLTGSDVAVALKACQRDGTITDPRPKLRAGSADGGFVVTNARLGGVTFALPARRARAVPAGLYRYDVLIAHADGRAERARYGLLLIDQGIA